MPASSCYHLCGTGLRLKASELQSTEGTTYGQEQGTAFPASLFLVRNCICKRIPEPQCSSYSVLLNFIN